MQIAAYPHAKKSDQERLHREAHRTAFPANYDDKPISLEELNKRLGVMLGG